MTTLIRIHESDHRPGVVLDDGANYVARASWALDNALFYDPTQRTTSNYRTTPEVFVDAASALDPVVLDVDLSWWDYIRSSIRVLYCLVEARLLDGPWTEVDLWGFVVNHDPLASLSPIHLIALDGAGNVQRDGVLDAGRSFDGDNVASVAPDNEPLAFSWALLDSPTNVDTSSPAYALLDSVPPLARAIALPAGTPTAASDVGEYRIRVSVTDSDISDIGVRLGQPGRGHADTRLIIQPATPNLQILSPTQANPLRLLPDANTLIGIAYSIGANVANGAALGGAWVLRLSITQQATFANAVVPVPVNTVVFEQTRVDPQLVSSFTWNGTIASADPMWAGRPAVGVHSVRIELLDRQAAATGDPAAIVSEVAAITVYGSRAQQVAAEVLAHPGITLMQAHVSGVVDNAVAQVNIADVAAGGGAARSNYDNAPGGTTALNQATLEAMLGLAASYTFTVSDIAGGSHSPGSLHYAGTAFDVFMIDGAVANAANPSVAAFMQACRNAGATLVLGPLPLPGNPGHLNHVHAQW